MFLVNLNLKYMNNYIFRILVLASLSLLGSCRIGKQQATPELDLPAAYRATPVVSSAETVLPVREFFKDPVLLELIDSAMAKNYDLNMAVKSIESSEQVFKKVKLNYLPDLTARMDANTTRPSKNSLGGIGNELFIGSYSVADFNTNLGLTWEIDIWGKVRTQKEEALSNYLQSVEATKAVQTRLVADIANGYYNLIMLDNQLRVAENMEAISDSTLRIITVQQSVGQVTILGVNQARAQLEFARQLIPQIEQSIALQENALSILCGSYPAAVVRKDFNEEEIIALTKPAYPASLLGARPDVRAAEHTLTAANARVGLTQIAMYPSLTISATGGLNTFKASNWFSVPASLFGMVAGGISQPVFLRGQLKMQHELAKIEREKAVLGFRQSVLLAVGEVENALVRQEKNDLQIQSSLSRVKSLTEARKNADLLFKTGMATYLEILNTQSAYLQSELDLAELKRQKKLAAIELYRALGGGWK